MKKKQLATLLVLAISAAMIIWAYCFFLQKPNEVVSEPLHTDAVIKNVPAVDLLILVNKDNKLPDDYEPDLTTGGAKFDKVLSGGLTEMRAAAKKENIYLMVGSAYRTAAEQEQLFNELGSSVAAQPGYSEHQTGLAIDFSYSGLSDEETNRMWNWLADNAYKYGFILRYPKDKENITGFPYEPWHFRYVGKVPAKAIFEQDLTLEEYLSK